MLKVVELVVILIVVFGGSCVELIKGIKVVMVK